MTEIPILTRARVVRFLDHLAINGNVRAAAAAAGVSHETAYRGRRQDAEFAALWDAALVHAREHSASVLATRALDGVEVAIVYHGEVTGYRTVHDPRLLLAHMARLDRQVEGNAPALARAGRFDELLAGYVGLSEPAGFACAAVERGDGPALPPTRDQFAAWRCDEVSEDFEGDDEADDDEWREALESAVSDATAEWDAWHDACLMVVDGVVRHGADESPSPGPACADDAPAADPAGAAPDEPPADCAPDEPPIEFKSAPRGARARRPVFSALDRVTSVKPGSPGVPPRRSGDGGNPARGAGRAAPAGAAQRWP
jgi:hypothetical protein